MPPPPPQWNSKLKLLVFSKKSNFVPFFFILAWFRRKNAQNFRAPRASAPHLMRFNAGACKMYQAPPRIFGQTVTYQTTHSYFDQKWYDTCKLLRALAMKIVPKSAIFRIAKKYHKKSFKSTQFLSKFPSKTLYLGTKSPLKPSILDQNPL